MDKKRYTGHNHYDLWISLILVGLWVMAVAVIEANI